MPIHCLALPLHDAPTGRPRTGHLKLAEKRTFKFCSNNNRRGPMTGQRSRRSLHCQSSCPASPRLVLNSGLGAHASVQDVQDVSRRVDQALMRAVAQPSYAVRPAACAGARPSSGTAPPRWRGEGDRSCESRFRNRAGNRSAQHCFQHTSPVREIRMLGSMSGERKRGQGGD